MPLSIILINYHSSQLLNDCLQTIYTDKAASGFEIIIIDNSNGDGAGAQVTKLFPLVKWIVMPGNMGFARANNAGIKASNGNAVLLLNPDTLIKDDAVSKCYQALMKSEYAACGVQLLNADGSPQISGNFVMTGGLNYLMQVPYAGSVIRWIALKAGVAKTNLPEAKQALTEVDWINGAFLMVKKSAIDKAGLLDEDFFLYHEESEWCSRLKKVGKLCIFGNLHVIHLEGQSANKAFNSGTTGYSNLADKKGFQLMLSMFVRFRKEFGAGWFLFHLFFYTLCILFLLLFSLFESIFGFNFQPIKVAAGFSVNVLRCWGFLFKILSGKPYFYKVL
ncbi:glycosyltransferase family 2 protein [soil metagenome]